MSKLILSFVLVLWLQTPSYGSGAVTSNLSINATVLPALKYSVTHKYPTIDIQSSLTVTHDKSVTVSEHYPKNLAFRNATKIVVVTNSLNGWGFEIEFLPNKFSSSVAIEIQGSGTVATLTVGEKKNIIVPYNSKFSDIKEIHYSFTVLKNPIEGTHPLPINIKVIQK